MSAHQGPGKTRGFRLYSNVSQSFYEVGTIVRVPENPPAFNAAYDYLMKRSWSIYATLPRHSPFIT